MASQDSQKLSWSVVKKNFFSNFPAKMGTNVEKKLVLIEEECSVEKNISRVFLIEMMFSGNN